MTNWPDITKTEASHLVREKGGIKMFEIFLVSIAVIVRQQRKLRKIPSWTKPKRLERG